MFVYSMTVDDPKMTADIIRVIDEQQDRQNYCTNVKAQMTEWKMQHMDGFRELCYYIDKAVQYASLTKYNMNVETLILSMWGLKYKSEDYAVEHSHYPALWSVAYYLNCTDDCPPIEFLNENGSWHSIQPSHGLLLIFEGHTKHRVPKKEFSGYRYVVSSNLVYDYTKYETPKSNIELTKIG